MKIFNLIFQLFIIIFFGLILLYWATAFNSAFEADRLCHSSLKNYQVESGSYGCDHDTETHQWILYENLDDSKAEVIQRFRYKFL